MAALAVLDQVSHAFAGTEVVRGVSLTIERGQRVALIGPSGAGKTTLLRLMAGVLRPTAGGVQLLGEDTRRLRGARLREIRRRVGFLYQHDNLIPQLRVVHNVAMGRLGRWGRLRALWSLLWPQEIDAIEAALHHVELRDRVWDYPTALSGGEGQRVAIARLLLQDPDLVLADEPASSLDVRLAGDVVTRLCRLARERDQGLVVSLHALELLGDHFDRVVALREGRICWEGPIAQWHAGLVSRVFAGEHGGGDEIGRMAASRTHAG